MDHPSMYNHEEDDEEPDFLPEGVTDDDVSRLIGEIVEATNSIGLYADPMVQLHGHDDLIVMVVRFEVGKVAFTKRVLDPEQDQFDDSFRKDIEVPGIKDQVKGIKDRFVDGD